MNILQDIKTAATVFKEVRRARKEGAAVETRTRKVWTVPVRKPDYWTWTMEATIFYHGEEKASVAVFDTFPEDVQHALTFGPKRGEWADRVRFWQEHLRPALPPREYHKVMLTLTHWGCHCIRKRLEAEV